MNKEKINLTDSSLQRINRWLAEKGGGGLGEIGEGD